MKYKILISALAIAVTGIAMAAQTPPQIDKARIDSAVTQVLKQISATPNTPQPDGTALRKQVINQLQTFEVLKKEAFKAGLNKDPEVQNEFKNLEAQFYASQYASYLEKSVTVSESDIIQVYNQQMRVIKLQQVQFNTLEEAKSAQALLLKGLSFDDLIKRYPNPEQNFTDFISPQQLPPELWHIVSTMVKGQITQQPVQLSNKFYLFKLTASEKSPNAPPMNKIHEQLVQQVKQQKVQQKISEILINNGINEF